MMTELMNKNLLQLKPSGIRRFTALAKSVPDCAMLTIGEPDFSTPAPIKDACKAALDADKTHYPPNTGEPALRAAIAEFEAAQNGLDYTADEIIVTSGATEALYTAITGMLNPGDEVIIPTPAFGLYESIVTMAGAVCVFLDTAPDGFQITPQALSAVMTARTKLIILNSPNNPTGSVCTQESLQAVHDAVAGKPVFILCDDVYARLVYAPCPMFARYRDLRSQILVVQSFSKPYAMTGWRMGYLMGDEPVIRQLALLHAAAVVSVAAFSQDACIQALKTDITPMVETYRRRRDYIWDRITAMGLPAVRPEGAFYIFPRISQFGMSSEEFCTRLITEGKAAGVPGTCFGAEGYVRFSFCYEMPSIARGMDRLEAFLNRLQR